MSVLARHNAWTKNVQPLTVIGDANWSTVQTTVDVLLPAAAEAGDDGRSPRGAAAAAAYVGVCQRVTGGGGQISNTAAQARPSLIPCLCTHFTRAGIEWRR